MELSDNGKGMQAVQSLVLSGSCPWAPRWYHPAESALCRGRGEAQHGGDAVCAAQQRPGSAQIHCYMEH